jgi:hypothetical protein
MSQNARGGGGLRGLSQRVRAVQKNFGDLTPYLTYVYNVRFFPGLRRPKHLADALGLFNYVYTEGLVFNSIVLSA